MMAIKLAFEATIITMIFMGILALLINLIKSKNICPVCGDPIPSDKDFCSEGCENDFYDDSHLEREKDEALAEQREMKREEA